MGDGDGICPTSSLEGAASSAPHSRGPALQLTARSEQAPTKRRPPRPRPHTDCESRPRRGHIHQPRAKPWVSRPIAESALKGRDPSARNYALSGLAFWPQVPRALPWADECDPFGVVDVNDRPESRIAGQNRRLASWPHGLPPFAQQWACIRVRAALGRPVRAQSTPERRDPRARRAPLQRTVPASQVELRRCTADRPIDPSEVRRWDSANSSSRHDT